MSSSLPEHLTSLLDPSSYPHPVRGIELVETHVSWVLLTGELAYKVKRPVHYPFVDLRSMELRAHYCAEEVRLNRRFSEGLYLDVCPITREAGRATFGGSGEVVEHAVRMRQFDRTQELDRLLETEAIPPTELADFGSALASIHAELPTPAPGQTLGSSSATVTIVRSNLDECAAAALHLHTDERVSSLRNPLFALASELEGLLASRFARGRVRECHGDLHSRNVTRDGGRLVAFDCLEFAPAFRWVDVADEVAFLHADLLRLERPLHATAFLDGYLGASGDYEGTRLLRLFEVHRALVRAKTAALGVSVASDASVREQAELEHRAWLSTAERALASAAPALVLVTGLSGSGKTWLARKLAGELSAVVLRSDVERKRLLGLGELERSESMPSGDAYSSDVTARTYERLQRGASAVLSSGRAAIVDATLLRREDRAAFRELGRRFGVVVRLVHCRAPRHVLLERIATRSALGRDASEATPPVLAWQESRIEAVGADEGFEVIEADTTRPGIAAELLGQLLHSA